MKNNDNKEFIFSKEMKEYISNVERTFDAVAKREGVDETMQSWIDNEIATIETEGIFNGLTDREKFLFSFATIATTLKDGLSN